MKTAGKSSENEIIEKIDIAINELVYEKTQIIKAYNYYHCKRDPEQFRHLEENYGIGTPTSIEFVPLVRKHIDVLLGEYLSTPVLPKISCKDKETISNINKDKESKVHSELVKELNKHLKDTLSSSLEGKYRNNISEVAQHLQGIQEAVERNYISDYEIAGQNIIEWSMQSRSVDFANQRKIMLTDLLVSGTCYYKVIPSADNSNITLRVLNPVNTFIDRNPESVYLKDSARSVIRDYLTKDQILVRYGEYLTPDDLAELDNLQDYSVDGSATTYLRSYDSITGNTTSDGVLGGFEITPLLPFERDTSKYFRVFPVYEVEWLRTDKENGEYICNRYCGTRIGTNIYIPTGKDKNIIRSIDDKKACTLLVNGIFYSDRNGDPYSLVLRTANLQDKSDILYFYRDNIIAESGTTGDWIDIAHLPTFLGPTEVERLIKFKAYKKQGLALFDSSQEGMDRAQMNTTFGGYDDTIKLQAIQAIDLAIERNEEQCSMITGVFKEKLGGIEQKDAVTNVQVGVRQSSYITKQYYQVMDLMTREILLDILNLTKIVYKKGISGTLILGDRLNKVFTALPKYYTVTDFDLHITDSSEIIKEQETIKQLGMELTKGNLVDPETLIEIITSKGLTRMKEDVKISLDKKKKENDQLGKLKQETEELNKQLKETTQEAQKLQQQVQKLNETKQQLEKDKLEFEKQIEWFKAKDQSSYNEEKLEWEKKRVQLEGLQLLDANHKNDKVKEK